MIWRRLFGQPGAALPPNTRTLLVVDAADSALAQPLADALQQKFGDLGIATIGTTQDSAYPSIKIDASGAAQRIADLNLHRVVAVGDAAATLLPAGPASYIVNATRPPARPAQRVFVAAPAFAEKIPSAIVSGDPLANLAPPVEENTEPTLCDRFKEQREGGRWVGYFAATGENEEDSAYLIFNRLIRHKMGLMILAPFDPARCEPVYRDAIKYRLQTIRHNRLSTSFVPIKTRVYYVEESAPLRAMYSCADWVVVGGTLAANSGVIPDIISPIRRKRPVVVGPYGKSTPLVQAAIRSEAVLSAVSEEQLFTHLKHLLDAPQAAAEQAERAFAWLIAQPGAVQRVVVGID